MAVFLVLTAIGLPGQAWANDHPCPDGQAWDNSVKHCTTPLVVTGKKTDTDDVFFPGTYVTGTETKASSPVAIPEESSADKSSESTEEPVATKTAPLDLSKPEQS